MMQQSEIQQSEPFSTRYSPSAGMRPLKTDIATAESSWISSLFGGNGEGKINVANGERLTSLAAGSILTVLGLKRRSVPGLLVAAAGTALAYRGTTGHCSLYEALGVDTAHDAKGASTTGGVQISQSFSINASPEKLYSFWRKLEQLPQVLTHIESIRELDERRSHWVAKPVTSLDTAVEWDAEIVRDEPNHLIAWRSLPSSSVETSGEIRFTKALGDRGTAVKVSMSYSPPGGRAGHLIAKLFGKSPKNFIREDLRNLKRFIELGEIPTTYGQTHGTCGAKSAR